MTSGVETPAEQPLDIFISYSPADERWATWLAGTLETTGYRTMLQAWDFVAGSRFIELMDRGVSESEVILAVLSRSYLRSRYGRMEWQAALRAAPENPATKLITVRVEDCDITGLLAQITYIDLVGIDDQAQAQSLVLQRVSEALAGRAKPPRYPSYPNVPTIPPTAQNLVPTPSRQLPAITPRYPIIEEPARDRSSITLLHLSGPRLGKSTLDADLHARIFSDVTELVHNGAPRPDLLVVSGDLTAAGGRGQFEAAKNLLSRLRVRIGLEPDRLVVVPGPTDVNRAACRAYFHDCEADDKSPTTPYWPKWRHYYWLFRELYQGIDNVLFECGQPWTLFSYPGLKLVIAGMNSSIPVSHRDEDQYGAIEHEQAAWFANRLHEYEDLGWLRIGVIRHAPGTHRDALRDTPVFERLVAPRLNLLLHGPTSDTSMTCLPVEDLPRARLATPGQAELLTVTADGFTQWNSHAARRGRRTACQWRAARSTFSPASQQPRDEIVVRDTADPTDHFLDRIEEVCRARHERVRIRRVKSARRYLGVTYNDAGVVRELIVAAHIGTPTIEHVEACRQLVRAVDSDAGIQLVYQGAPPEHGLRERARLLGVRVRSFTEFQGLLDLRSYVTSQTTRLKADRQYSPDLYVPQRYAELDRAEHPVHDGLVEELLRQLGSDHGRFILLLGDFGRGKTFALRELARRIPSELPQLTPILIELRALDKAHSIEGLVAAHLADHEEQHIDLRAFRYMLRQGRIVLLFDGFDELVIRTTYDRATDHLDSLLAAATDAAKIVVTSRTQHFESSAQVLTKLGERVGILPQRRLLSVEGFTPAQVREYLVNYYGRDAQRADARLRLINGIGHLGELSQNPRLLGFVAILEERQLRLVAQAGHARSPASLYREILSSWLRFEERRTRDIPGTPVDLTLEELWQAVIVLALRLWESSESALHQSDLVEVADTLTGLVENPRSTGQLTHAIGTGTLLVRTEEGLFSFIHDSVMEWLVAKEIADRMARGSCSLLSRQALSQLTVDFLCDLAEPRLCERWATGVLSDSHSEEVSRRNALKINSRLRIPAQANLRGAAMRNEDLSFRDFREVDLTGADLRDARLVGANLSAAILRGARLIGARLDEADLTDADLTEADLTGARLAKTNLTGARVTGGRWQGAALIATTGTAGLRWRHELRGAAIAPGMPVEPQLAPATIGVPYGFHIQFGRLPLPVAHSQDGHTIALGCSNGAVVICDASTAMPIRVLRAHRGRVYAVVAAGETLLTAGADQALRRWDITTGQQLWESTGFSEWVWPVVVNASGSLVAVSDSTGTIMVRDTTDGAVRNRLPGATAPVWTAEFSPDGRLLACGGSSSTVRLWDTTTGELVHQFSGHSGTRPERELAGHTGSVYRLTYHPGGHLLATADEAGTVRIWDLRTGHLRHRFDGHTRSVYALDFHPGGELLVSADTSGTIRLWSLSKGRSLSAIEAHRNAVYQVLFSQNGSLLATCDSAGATRLWSVDPELSVPVRPHADLVGHRAAVWPGSFSPDNQRFVTAGNDGTVRFWDTADGRCRQIVRGHGRRITSVSFSPCGSLLAACGNDGIVRLWNTVTGCQIREVTGTVERLVSAVFSPAGRALAAASNSGGMSLFNPDTGLTEREFGVETERVWAEAFSPDGRVLATANDDDTVRMWFHHTGAQGDTFGEHRGRVRSVAFNPAGTVLASGCDDTRVRLWDVASGNCLATLHGHTDRVYSVSYNPDGSQLASASWDGSIRVWDITTGDCQRIIRANTGRTWTAVFHPTARLLASAGDDGDVQLWDPATGQRLDVLSGHTDRVLAVTFSPDGQLLASGGDDGTVRLWDVSHPARVCHRVTLVGKPDGWAAVGARGRYKLYGSMGGEFWHVIGTCRFEPGELEAHVTDIGTLSMEAPFS